jgi:hypothetical protein
MVNEVDRKTTPILNPESVSRYDRLHVVRHCHNVDIPQKTINHEFFFKLTVSAYFTAYHCTILRYTEQFFWFTFEWPYRTQAVFQVFSRS